MIRVISGNAETDFEISVATKHEYSDSNEISHNGYNLSLTQDMKPDIVKGEIDDEELMIKNENPVSSDDQIDNQTWITSEEEKFICDICIKKFKSKQKLTAHMRYHQKDVLLICKECGYQTSFMDAFKKHLLVHKRQRQKLADNNLFIYREYNCGKLTEKSMMVEEDVSKIRMFSCNVCPYKSKHKQVLGRHLLTHKLASEVTMFSCGQCTYRSKYKRNLRRHEKCHDATTDLWECDDCGCRFRNKVNLRNHIKKHAFMLMDETNKSSSSNNRWFECYGCGKGYKSKWRLQQHIAKCIKTYVDSKDDTKVNNMKPLPSIKVEDIEYSTQFIAVEQKDVISTVDVTEDIKIIDRRPFDSLKEEFDSDLIGEELIIKEEQEVCISTDSEDEVETEVKRFTCPECSFSTKSKIQLEKHITRNTHTIEDDLFMCNDCPFQTKIKSNLKRHLSQQHSKDVTVFQCNDCDYSTRVKGNLKIHINAKHLKEVELFSCKKCDFTTKYKQSLRFHYKCRHKEEKEVKMFACDLCSCEFKLRSYLKRHMLIHKDESEVQMLKCDRCMFVSKHRKSLRDHMVIHKSAEELKLHQCDKCNFQTKHKRYLRAHQAKKHPRKIARHQPL